MKKFLKKSVAIILTMAMLFSILNVAVFASDDVAAMASGNYKILPMGSTIADITTEGGLDWFEFVPETSGKYVFESETYDVYTRAYLYDSSMGLIAQSEGDSEKSGKYKIITELNAGETYYLAVGLVNDELCSFSILTRLSPINSVGFSDVVFYETDAYKHTDIDGVEYKRYNWYYRLDYTVGMENGEAIQGSGIDFWYNDRWYSFDYEDPQTAENPWTPGNTYPVYLTVDGCTSVLNVTIKESPVASIDIDSYDIIKHTKGLYTTDYDDENDIETDKYYHYSYWCDEDLEFTINFKDGTSTQATGNGFEYNGQYHGISYKSPEQSYEKQWTVGSSHKVILQILGSEHEIDLNIVESPVSSVEFLDNEYIENYDGNKCYDYNEETGENDLEYFEYNWYYNFPYRINLKNGDVIEGDDFWFEYNGKSYSFTREGSQNFSGDQSYENQWTVGEYTIPLEVMGYETEYTLKIVESPVADISVEPITLIENIDGDYSTDWDDETEQSVEYFRYTWWHNLKYTVTLKNGQIIESDDNGNLYYNGEYINPDWSDKQNFREPWGIGENTGEINVLGYKCDVNVTIIDTPIESISFEPISIRENTDCHERPAYNEETGEWDLTYKYYYWDNMLNYTITMKDGQVITGSGSGFEYNNYYYNFECDDDQDYGNEWGAGSHNVTISAIGYTTNLTVEITESPIAKVEIAPISIVEGTHGSYYTYYDHETGTENEYYYYDVYSFLNGTVTLKDGTVYKMSSGHIYTNGEVDFRTSWSTHQNYNNRWLLGNTYNIEVNVDGYIVEVPVTIIPSPIASIEIDPIIIAEGTNCDMSSAYNPDTGDSDLYYNQYWWRNKLKYTVKFTDGTEIVQDSSGGFNYNDEWYDVQTSEVDVQCYENAWVAGGSYRISVSIMGKTAESTVSILNQRTEGDYTYLVQGDGAIIIGCNSSEKVVNIPSTLGGYPVIGITGLYCNAEEIVIPDGITSISDEIFYDCYNVKKITLGKDVVFIKNSMFNSCYDLEQIIVSNSNPYYASVDGIVYDKEKTKMIAIPYAKETKHTVPDTTTNIDVYFTGGHSFELDLGNSNTGYMYEDGVMYDKDKTVIYLCDKKKTGKYDMPDTVTQINSMAFNNSNLTEVTISDNVTEIVYYSFAGSINLEKVVLPKNLESIGESAFRDCKKLDNVTLPSKLAYIGEHAFDRTGIKSITIPASTTSIEYAAFSNSALETLTLNEGIEYIGICAFEGTKIKKLVLPNSLHSMGHDAFASTPLTELTIGKGLEYISSSAFSGTQLTNVVIPDNISYVGSYAFAGSKIQNVDFKNKNIAIGEGAFYNCPIKNLQLHEGMTQIESLAFYGISATEVDIPESVTDIAYKSFENSKNLATIDISDNVQSIGGLTFHGTAWYNSQNDGVVYLENALYSYKGEMKENTEITVKEGTKLISDFAFDDQYYLKKITIPASVEYIGSDAFTTCINLEEIVIDQDNENYTFEDGTLYDKYGYPVWSKVIGVNYFDCYKTKFKYGESFKFGEAELSFERANGSDLYFRSWATLWFKIAPDKFVTGYNPYQSGIQTVTVQIGKWEYKYDVTVEEPTVTGVTLNKSTLDLKVGESSTLVANVVPAAAPNKSVIWQSSDTSVASVGPTGKVTAKKIGVATISAVTTVGKFVAECVVNVSCSHTNTTKVAAKASTCKVQGNAAYTKCNDCNTVISGSSAKLPLGNHKYDNNCDKTCNVCGATRSIKHTYEKKVIKATLSKNGKIQNVCSVCDYTSSSSTTIYYPKTFTLSATSYTYDGKVKTPTVTVKDSAGKTISSSNYTVTYESGRKNAGTYDVKVAFKGNYSGTKTLTFKINPISYSKCSFKLSATSYTYDGKTKSPSVTVKNASGSTLKKDTDYTVTYASGRKSVGTYKVTIKMKGNYSGTKTLTFKINPVKTTVSKLTPAKKSLKVSITKKTSQVTGYEIQYSTSKSFSSYKTKKISSYKTTSTTLSSLKAKTTYYVRVRTYKTVNGTKYYSGWSSYKSAKTK